MAMIKIKPPELSRLISQAKNQNEPTAWHVLYEQASQIASFWSKQIAKSSPFYKDVDELYMAGMETLPSAVKCYRQTKGSWEKYIRRCIINAMKKLVSKMNKKSISTDKKPGVLYLSWLLENLERYGLPQVTFAKANEKAKCSIESLIYCPPDIEKQQELKKILEDALSLGKQKMPLGYKIFCSRHCEDNDWIGTRKWEDVKRNLSLNISPITISKKYKKFLELIRLESRTSSDESHHHD